MILTLSADVIGFATLASCLLMLVGFAIAQAAKNEKTKATLFRRLDDERVFNAQTYTRQDVHDAKYDTMERDVSEIKADIKKLLIKNGIK